MKSDDIPFVKDAQKLNQMCGNDILEVLNLMNTHVTVWAQPCCGTLFLVGNYEYSYDCETFFKDVFSTLMLDHVFIGVF